MKRYIIFDRTGNKVGIPFKSYKDAEEYKIIFGRMDWKIESINIKITKRSTPRQKTAINFCEQWLDIKFCGNIEDFYDCSEFLSEYLDNAKEVASDAESSYFSMLNGY